MDWVLCSPPFVSACAVPRISFWPSLSRRTRVQTHGQVRTAECVGREGDIRGTLFACATYAYTNFSDRISCSVCLSVFCVCLSDCPYINLFVFVCLCLSVFLSVSLSLSVSLRLSVSLSLCLCLCLSVCLSVSLLLFIVV